MKIMRRKGGFPVWGEMVMAAMPFAVLGYLLLARFVPVEMSRLTEQRRLASLGSLGIAKSLLVDQDRFEAAWEKNIVRIEDVSGLLADDMTGDGILYDASSNLLSGIDQTAEARLYFYKDDAIYDADEEEFLNTPVKDRIPEASYEAMRSCAGTNQIVSAVFDDSLGRWMAAYTPVVGKSGDVIGVIELISNAESTLLSGQEDTGDVSRIILYVSLGLMSAVFFTAWINMRPLKNLKVAALAAAEGNLESVAKTGGNSEAAVIAGVFNRMLKGISGHISQMEAFQTRYAAFFPNEVFFLLGNQDVSHTRLGDEREIEAFVMAVQGKQKDDERLPDRNRQLEVQISEIQQHEGIISEFRENGEESFFPDNAADVLHCAVSILQRTGQAESQSRLCIGVAYGGVKTGIIGGRGRNSVAVVSEYKRLSWFLQEMAEVYGASLLITDKAAKKSTEFEKSYHYRMLGYVYLTLHGTLERIYEVLDGDSEVVLSRKYRSRDLFETGVDCFMCGRFLEARSKFIQVVSMDKDDIAAQRYVHLCDQYYREAAREDSLVCLEIY